MAADGVTVITGFPSGILGTRVLRHAVAQDATAEVRCIVPPQHMERARAVLGTMDPSSRKRVELLEGDPTAMDMGLSGAEFKALAREARVVHHCVAYTGSDRAKAGRVNVEGAREVLELADCAPDLDRVVHWSTASVAGARRGYVMEHELVAPAGFHNAVEASRFQAEQIMRESMDHIPITVLRPTSVVGDSETGEIDRFEGPYLLVLLMLNAPVDLRLPMPGKGEVPLNLVPVDFVVKAGCAIARDPRSVGRTFHIVDPAPLTARRVFELIADAAGRRLPRGSVPTSLASALLKTPGLDKLAQGPRAFLEQLKTEVIWDDRNAREILAGTGIECPSFESYAQTMVQYVRKRQAERRARSAEKAFREHDAAV